MLLTYIMRAFLCSFTCSFFFFFNDTATTEIYTLSLHDALPIYAAAAELVVEAVGGAEGGLEALSQFGHRDYDTGSRSKGQTARCQTFRYTPRCRDAEWI